MKITKYPQSCILIEENGKRILIDPGSFVAQKYSANDFAGLDAILITHEHFDHADKKLIDDLLVVDKNVTIYSNKSVARNLGINLINIVKDKDRFDIDGVEIVAINIPHVLMPNGQAGPENTGYIISNKLLHPGDGLLVNNINVPIVVAPIAGPDISPKDVYEFVKKVGAKTVIPMHYDYFIADPLRFVQILDFVEVIPLKDGQTADV